MEKDPLQYHPIQTIFFTVCIFLLQHQRYPRQWKNFFSKNLRFFFRSFQTSEKFSLMLSLHIKHPSNTPLQISTQKKVYRRERTTVQLTSMVTFANDFCLETDILSLPHSWPGGRTHTNVQAGVCGDHWKRTRCVILWKVKFCRKKVAEVV